MTPARNWPQRRKKRSARQKPPGKKAGLVMATITSEQLSSPAEGRDERANPSNLLAEIRDFWRQFFVRAFDPYRPELHYMRGPGPACRAKQTGSAQPHSS
jgi:hypothetical protein